MTEYVTGQIYGWNGGECPVHPETKIKIWTRNGLFCSELTTLAKSCFWDHVEHPRDIVCFQVVTPQVEPQPPAIDPADRIKELEKQCSAYARADRLFVEEINDLEAKLTKAVGVIKALLERDERNTCQHENTERGGVLWEICLDCGCKWADDEGGKPMWKDPQEWVDASATLAELEGR